MSGPANAAGSETPLKTHLRVAHELVEADIDAMVAGIGAAGGVAPMAAAFALISKAYRLMRADGLTPAQAAGFIGRHADDLKDALG